MASDADCESYALVVERLYIGDRKFAKNKEALQNLGIKFIVNATERAELDGGVHNFFESDSSFSYQRCAVADSEAANIAQFFDSSHSFIADGLATGYGVLVHCQQGVSRSASIVLAYLMRAHKLSLREAYALLKQKRPIVKPSANFLRQLVEFEKASKGAVPAAVSTAASASNSGTLGPDGASAPIAPSAAAGSSAASSKKRALDEHNASVTDAESTSDALSNAVDSVAKKGKIADEPTKSTSSAPRVAGPQRPPVQPV